MTNAKPILMNAEMVRATLREIEAPGTGKTQTRRIIKPGPPPCQTGPNAMYRHGDGWRYSGVIYDDQAVETCPYGKPGDLLYVREAWADQHPIAIQEGRYSQTGLAGIPGPPPVSYRTIYRADGEPRQIWRKDGGDHPYFTLDGPSDELSAKYPTICSNYTRKNGEGVMWIPSIHMPRWASRITLEITDVRVQRLQDISEADAKAEGVLRDTDGWRDYMMPCTQCCATACDSYKTLWSAINGPDAWGRNDWLWAVSFKPHLINVDQFISRKEAP